MGKAIQCPSCGRNHGVDGLPDAPSFLCEGCGQRLKVPAQFRPSVMTSRHVPRADPAGKPQSTSVLPGVAASAAAASAARPARAAARAPVPPRPPAGAAPSAGPRPIALPLRLLAWVVALALGLLVTFWIGRITDWLSGDRLVDVFTGTGGSTRYIRVLALAPVWALFTTLLLTLFLEGGRALAQRRKAAHGERRGWRRQRRAAAKRVDASPDDPAGEAAFGDGQRYRRKAARRGGP